MTLNQKIKKTTLFFFLIFCAISLISCNNCLSIQTQPNTTSTANSLTFFALDVKGNTYYNVEVIKSKTGKHCILYLEKNNANLMTAENINLLVNNFDTSIYPTVRKYYGEESDIDQNGKVILFGLDIRDSGSISGSYVGGYFNSVDLINHRFSNSKDMVYIDIVEGFSPGNTAQLFSTIAHEFAHLVSYNERILKRNLPPLEIWLEEGIAQGAEHLYQNNWLTNSLWNFTNSIDIIAGKRFLAWGVDTKNLSGTSSIGDNYSSVYLFIQWLRTLTIDSVQHYLYHQIITNNYSGYRAIENIARQYITNFSATSTWDDMFRDWNISCFVNSFTTERLYQYYDKLLPTDLKSTRFQLPQIWHESTLPFLYPGEAATISTFNASFPYNALSPTTINRQNIKHAGIIISESITGKINNKNNFKYTIINSNNLMINQHKIVKQVNSSFRHTNRFLLAYHTGTNYSSEIQEEQIFLNITASNSLPPAAKQYLNTPSIPAIHSKISTRKLFPACALHHSH